jgi:hypothetical protein
MRNRPLIIAAGLLVLLASLALVVFLTAALTPDQTHPAFATAVAFAEAAARGNEDAAAALMTPELAAWVAQNCPEGRVSACVQASTPPEWGDLISAVFRRAAPDGPNWDVDLIATYQFEQGFSGVCIYTQLVPDGEAWKVAAYAGFVWCGDPATRNMAANADAPNRAPAAP